MAEQLFGVLRQVVAIDGGSPTPAAERAVQRRTRCVSADASPWQFLPLPAVDPTDPAAGVLATLALLGADQRQALIESTPRSTELSLSVVRLAIEEGEFEAAADELASSEARDSGWRAAWWRGVLHLAEGRASDACATSPPSRPSCRASCSEARPGDVLRGRGECARRSDRCVWRDRHRAAQQAARYYLLVAATDPSYASAGFGLARVDMALGDREGAVAALQRIPKSSSSYAVAQITSAGRTARRGEAGCRIWAT